MTAENLFYFLSWTLALYEATVFNSQMIRRKPTAARRRSFSFLMLFPLLLLVIFPAAAAGDELPPPEESKFTGPCMGEKAFEKTWFDRTHSYLTAMLCQPAVWFDGFFGQHRAGEDWAGSLIRWGEAVRFDERLQKPEYNSEFIADFRLPNMNKKVKIFISSISGEDETSSQPDEYPYDLGTSGVEGDNQQRTTAGLKIYLSDTRKVRLNLGAGLKLGDTPQIYIRARLRYTEPISNDTLLRLTPTVIWLEEDGINRSLRVDLEHRVSENVFVRSSQSLVRKELEPDILWGSVLTLYDRLSPVTVLALEAGAKGTTSPEKRVERYRLSTRLRSNFLREWLFLEVEPEYYWPLDEAGEYHLFRAISFRVQVQFYS